MPQRCIATGCKERPVAGEYLCVRHLRAHHSQRGGWIASWRNKMGQLWLAMRRRRR